MVHKDGTLASLQHLKNMVSSATYGTFRRPAANFLFLWSIPERGFMRHLYDTIVVHCRFYCGVHVL